MKLILKNWILQGIDYLRNWMWDESLFLKSQEKGGGNNKAWKMCQEDALSFIYSAALVGSVQQN